MAWLCLKNTKISSKGLWTVYNAYNNFLDYVSTMLVLDFTLHSDDSIVPKQINMSLSVLILSIINRFKRSNVEEKIFCSEESLDRVVKQDWLHLFNIELIVQPYNELKPRFKQPSVSKTCVYTTTTSHQSNGKFQKVCIFRANSTKMLLKLLNSDYQSRLFKDQRIKCQSS